MLFDKDLSTSTNTRPISVKELVYKMKDAISVSIGTLWVEGELSNVKYATSGHIYFTLKEQGAEIFCAFFKNAALSCPFRLEEGMKVHVLGTATVYPERGQLQLVIKQAKKAGQGDLQAQFLALKEKLQKEGLFDTSHKRSIPKFPKSIGIVTSSTGAVIQDIRHVLERRAPWIKAYLLPVRVQGMGAEKEIANAINAWSNAPKNGLPPVDLIIVGRGGGSIEDLWNFNEEIVARAIYHCSIPVISAVGHETDFTIADFVADLRAPTPTAAAELATPDGPELHNKLSRQAQILKNHLDYIYRQAQLKLSFFERSKLCHVEEILAPFYQNLDWYEEALKTKVDFSIQQRKDKLTKLAHQLELRHPAQLNQARKQLIDKLEAQFTYSAQNRLQFLKNELQLLQTRLAAHDPKHTLKRGYAILKTQDNKLLRSVKNLQSGQEVSIHLADGSTKASIK